MKAMRFSDDEIADCKGSHRATTWRNDRHSFRLFFSNAQRLNLQLESATSKEEALSMLASVFAATTKNHGLPLSASDKMRSSMIWIINYVWDPVWRMRCIMRTAQEARPSVQAAPREDSDVTSFLGLLALPRWLASTPNRHIPTDLTSHRGMGLCMVFSGTRFEELVHMCWELWTRTDEYHEFILRIKNQKKLQRVRWFHLPDSSLDPYQAIDDVYAQETAKQRHLFGRTQPTGPIWTDGKGTAWSSSDASHAITHILSAANLPCKSPYRVKAWTVTALCGANVPLADIAKFIRHSVSSGNLDKFYVVDDKGKSCSLMLDALAKGTDN
jgi:hypothetical protein